MSRYIAVVDLWDSKIDTALREGKLVLQRGQWVRCGAGKLSRWVGKNRHTLNVAHYPNATGQNFFERCYYHKKSLTASQQYFTADGLGV